MSLQVVQEYAALLARAFNGAIEVDDHRIVAHPSGTLIVRPRTGAPSRPAPRPSELAPSVLDHDNDWSNV